METIIVDMDSTLNLFTLHLANWIVARGYELTDMVEQTWSLSKWIKDVEKKDADKIVSDICCTKGFWLQIPVMKNAIRIIKKMNDAYDIIIATVPWSNAPYCKEEKIEWMSEYFPFIYKDQITFKEEKWEIPAKAIIDDKPETIEKFPGITVVMDYGYNKDVKATYRVNNWIQIGNIFQYEICKRFPLFAELQGRNFWVNKFVKFYHKMGSNSVNFTISDLRFPHEIETIKKLEKEVYVVKINRPCLDCNDSHESEKAIDSLKCDLVLDNDKDFDSLYKLIESTIWDLTTDEAGFPLDKN